MTPRPIPFTPMHQLYKDARKMGQKRRLGLAKRFVSEPEALGAIFGTSVDAYRSGYENIGEPFHPKKNRKKLLPLLPGDDIERGYDLTRILAHGSRSWAIEGCPSATAFKFVDYEIAPLRTTGGAAFEGAKSGRGPVADLLLVAADGTPVIGEIKVATATRYDTDPVMALIQGLTLAATLATPQQRERLANHYPDRGFKTDGPLGLWVLSVKPPEPPKAKYQSCLAGAARDLADAIRNKPSISAALRHLEFIEARWDGNGLRLIKGV